MQPLRRRSAPAARALTRLETIVVVGLLLAIVLWFLLLPRCTSRELSPKAVCQSNLKGIGTIFYTYANENNGMWPVCAPIKAIDEGKLRVTYAPNLIGKNRDVSDETLIARATGDELKTSVTRNLWILVRLQISPPKSFNCPQDPDSTENMDQSPQSYWDFRTWSEVSYGYQVPFGKLGRPSSDRDQRMVMAADKGPFGAALEAGKPNPGLPTAAMNDAYKKWSPWNSHNHGGEGQNVLYAGGSADWQSKPVCGLGYDNIYTRWSDATGGATTAGDNPPIRVHGTPPTGTETPMSDTDTLIYP